MLLFLISCYYSIKLPNIPVVLLFVSTSIVPVQEQLDKDEAAALISPNWEHPNEIFMFRVFEQLDGGFLSFALISFCMLLGLDVCAIWLITTFHLKLKANANKIKSMLILSQYLTQNFHSFLNLWAYHLINNCIWNYTWKKSLQIIDDNWRSLSQLHVKIDP